jgi:hypothetical protein
MCIVPARDEQDQVGETVRQLFRMVPPPELVVVVDDGSVDGTAAAAGAAGATVLRSRRNIGKGGAIEAALGYFDVPAVYLLVDADTGQTAGGAAPLVEAVRSGGIDLAIGRLPRPSSGGFGLVKRLAAWLIKRATGFEAIEPLSGQRAVTGAALQACRPLAPGFGVETAMTIDAVRRGFHVVELDVEMRHRPTGRDLLGFVHRGRQGADIMVAGMLRVLGRP